MPEEAAQSVPSLLAGLDQPETAERPDVTAKGGRATFKMPASKVTMTAAFTEYNSMLNFFADVTTDQYYYDTVLWAVSLGIAVSYTAETLQQGVTTPLCPLSPAQERRS